MDDEPLVAGPRVLGAAWPPLGQGQGQARRAPLDVNTLAEEDATQLPDPNAIGHVELLLQEPIAALPYTQSRVLGALVLVDTATHKTSGAAAGELDLHQEPWGCPYGPTAGGLASANQ
jgi:sulfate adenylyltransferase subunit 1